MKPIDMREVRQILIDHPDTDLSQVARDWLLQSFDMIDTLTDALGHRMDALTKLLPTPDERRAIHRFVKGNDPIRECSTVMKCLRRLALPPGAQ